MAFGLIPDKDIPKYKKRLDHFFEDYLEIKREFTIDCESLNVDYYNSESITSIRYRKPNKESIYVAEIFKESDESAYFFGLARDPTVATSNHLNRGDQIKPLLVTTLNTSDKNNSGLVFAQNMDNYQIVLLMRIDCSELDDIKLKVLKDKNNIIYFKDGKGFINFGPVGNFYMLRDIRNFISNVTLVNQNLPYTKVVDVEIPDDYNTFIDNTELSSKSIYDKLTRSVSSLTFGMGTQGDEEVNNELEVQEEDNSVDCTVSELNDSSEDININQDDDYKNYYFEEESLFIEASVPKEEIFDLLNSIDNLNKLISSQLNNIQINHNINGNVDVNMDLLIDNDEIEFIESYLIKLQFFITSLSD